MANEQPKEKEQPQWNEAEWGKLAGRTFDKCPHCGCPSRYSVEALRGDMPEEALNNKPPAMGALQFAYDNPLFRINLTVVVDSCCKCGTIYTVARSKRKTLLAMIPKGRGMPPFPSAR